MKKIIIFFCLFLLTGCTDSSYLNNTCYLEEKANTLTSKIEYTFFFRNDIIDKVDVIYTYTDSNSVSISSIKLSMETQNKFLQSPNFEVIEDDKNTYKVKYSLTKDSNESLKDHFVIVEKRSDLQRNLQKKGYVCK